MGQPPTEYAANQAWEDASATFNELRGGPGAHISYGSFAPSEEDLRLLGPLEGLTVLDLGCGGGQDTVQFAQRGALVVAVDFSAQQLAVAQELARSCSVRAAFLLDRAETLNQVSSASVDLIFSAGVFQYVEEIRSCLAACRRVLRARGQLVFSVDHPFRGCFYDSETQELTSYPDRSYFDAGPRSWNFAETGAVMRTYERPVSIWIDLLHEAGFRIRRLLEPPAPPDLLEELFPHDGPLAALRNIPHTLIVSAELTDSPQDFEGWTRTK